MAVKTLKAANGKLYAVASSTLYELDTAYTATSLGDIGAVGNVTLADNGSKLLISTGYLYDYASSTLSAITDPDYPGGPAVADECTVEYADTYFIVNAPSTGRIQISSDGETWDSLDFTTAEGAPDDVVGLIVNHREVWVFGDLSTEVYYNSGNADFPYERISGAFMEVGCQAARTIAKMDNSIFWLGKDARGSGIVFRANGYQPQRISTHAIEYAIQGYATTSDSFAFTYQQEGHSFYVLTFPTAGKTWVYDASTSLWHERANFAQGVWSRWRPNCYAFFNNAHLVGDWETNKIYELDLDAHANGTEVKRWLRSFRVPGNEGKRVRFNRLELEMDVGVGLTTGQGSDPQIMLRWSDDGGMTWSNEHWCSAGAIGEYKNRVLWRRLGSSRDRIFEISGSDPVKTAIVAAYIEAEA